ncbi:MAG: hypothetical protein KKB50_20100, partial [Planctomycetes bacterium]|nr:hypothetical protein [Planctomycetota bacterium]
MSLLEQSGRHCGVVSVPHCGSGELVAAFWDKGGAPAGDSALLIDAFESDPALLASAQQKVDALGLLGRNVYVRRGTLSNRDNSLPYADHFVDLMAITGLTDADLAQLSYAEVERVLCTGAKAWIGRAASEGAGLTTTALSAWISGTHELSTATVTTDAAGTWAVITKVERIPDTLDGYAFNYRGAGRYPSKGSMFFDDQKATWPCLPQSFVKPYGFPRKRNIFGNLTDVPEARFCSAGGGRVYHLLMDPSWDGLRGNTLRAARLHNGQALWARRVDIAMFANVGWPYAAAGDTHFSFQPFSGGVVYEDEVIDGETGLT